ncbi:hypothetical protein [Microbacterium allomyrinae]|uniref:Uncharacterized protein n=1 Tax=Microbacterium allomyrinae TaxID=2830666 RepID=A0A9X1LVC6_9MICO|nr:hypothetical protein [Microbacterium allomyrinae]MCC2032664.1 hypothetical protein [Microbacterium allomyrinae]
MTSLDVGSAEDARRFRLGAQTNAFVASGVVLLICLAVVVLYAVLASASTFVLIGDITGFQVAYFSGVVGLVALAAFVLFAPAPRWWPYLAVPVTAVGGALAILLAVVGGQFAADTKVTSLVAEGCATGYIAIEPSGGGGSFIGLRDGWRVVSVQQFAGDDFSRPFAAGDYVARNKDGEIAVWRDGDPASPAFTLPQLPSHVCQ